LAVAAISSRAGSASLLCGDTSVREGFGSAAGESEPCNEG
jgi:hypothetical protein